MSTQSSTPGHAAERLREALDTTFGNDVSIVEYLLIGDPDLCDRLLAAIESFNPDEPEHRFTQQRPARESGGVQCQKDEGHDGRHALLDVPTWAPSPIVSTGRSTTPEPSEGITASITLEHQAPAPDQTERDKDRINAAARLGLVRQKHPELSRHEAEARVDLAAAIMAMDTVDERIQAGEKTHSVNQQIAVEQAQRAYAQALAGLVRGEKES